MKISYQAFIDKIYQSENEQLPFVAFRFPNEKELHFICQNNDTLYPIDWQDKGFVIHSFTGDKAYLLRTENHFVTEFIPKENNFYQKKNIQPNFPKFIPLVEKAIKSIQIGDFQKVVLSERYSVETSISSLSVYFERLINSYPSAFCYVFYHPKIGKWAAATPEILLKINQNKLETMSLAGTQKISEGVLPSWKEKEKEEQKIVTTTIVTKLQQFVKNLVISELKTIRAGNLWHLCTNILGDVEDISSVNQIVKALHPTPAVCGEPTEKAQQFILQNETYNREFYTGFCGLINFPAMNTFSVFVNLRCMQLLENKAYIYVGGGITQNSNPEFEQKEIQNKAQTMLKILFS